MRDPFENTFKILRTLFCKMPMFGLTSHEIANFCSPTMTHHFSLTRSTLSCFSCYTRGAFCLSQKTTDAGLVYLLFLKKPKTLAETSSTRHGHGIACKRNSLDGFQIVHRPRHVPSSGRIDRPESTGRCSSRARGWPGLQVVQRHSQGPRLRQAGQDWCVRQHHPAQQQGQRVPRRSLEQQGPGAEPAVGFHLPVHIHRKKKRIHQSR